MPTTDERLMDLALEEARRCLEWGDVPVGAVVTQGEEVLGAAGNQRERLGDPTAHAEILAIGEAARRVEGWRLEGCSIYVTLEPDAMCAGSDGPGQVGPPRVRRNGPEGRLCRIAGRPHPRRAAEPPVGGRLGRAGGGSGRPAQGILRGSAGRPPPVGWVDGLRLPATAPADMASHPGGSHRIIVPFVLTSGSRPGGRGRGSGHVAQEPTQKRCRGDRTDYPTPRLERRREGRGS
jgi:hypothetical protein